jgi:hypothetical protein
MHRVQSGIDTAGRLVGQTEDDHARVRLPGQRQEVSEVKVDRENGPLLVSRLGDDLGVGQSVEAFIGQVDGVVPTVLQMAHAEGANAHIRQEAHRSSHPLDDVIRLVAHHGGCEPQALSDIVLFEVRVGFEDLGVRHATRYKVNNE